MTHRKKVGDLYAIPLPDNTFAYGRVLQEVCAVWENEHIIDRLMGGDFKRWFPNFYG